MYRSPWEITTSARGEPRPFAEASLSFKFFGKISAAVTSSLSTPSPLTSTGTPFLRPISSANRVQASIFRADIMRHRFSYSLILSLSVMTATFVHADDSP